MLVALATACGDDDDSSADPTSAATAPATAVATTTPTTAVATSTSTTAVPTTAASLDAQIVAELGSLQRSTIDEVPGLVALFYHHPDGWAVEDVSTDGGSTWCRHAWYEWSLTDVQADDAFTVVYAPIEEPPDCSPLGVTLSLVVDGRTDGGGHTVFTGTYQPVGLHVTREVCPGTIDDVDDVCGISSGLGVPPPPT